MMTPAVVWEKWIYMVRKLVSKSIPIVHHVTIPCSESLLISSSEGTVAMKVSGLLELGTLLLLLRVVLYLPTYFVFFNVLFPVCVSALFEIRDYLPYGCLFSAPPMAYKSPFPSPPTYMHWHFSVPSSTPSV